MIIKKSIKVLVVVIATIFLLALLGLAGVGYYGINSGKFNVGIENGSFYVNKPIPITPTSAAPVATPSPTPEEGWFDKTTTTVKGWFK